MSNFVVASAGYSTPDGQVSINAHFYGSTDASGLSIVSQKFYVPASKLTLTSNADGSVTLAGKGFIYDWRNPAAPVTDMGNADVSLTLFADGRAKYHVEDGSDVIDSGGEVTPNVQVGAVIL